jgi:uncharacterized protein (DUF58 family)
MKRMITFVLTLIVLILGALIVFTNPLDPLAIIFGMFLVSAAILNLSIQIYFPPSPEQTVELKVVEEPVKASENVEKSRKIVKKRKKS